jgi:NAD(P) transhydrogenase subunit beta
MGKAMNRSITNVLFGAFGSVKGGEGGAGAARRGAGDGARIQVDDVATMLAYAQQVVIVPGYGMAVAQAQHSVRELADELEKTRRRGEVRDPSGRRTHARSHERAARRSERAVPALYDMDDINPEFPRTDVALVIGANDVTNPARATSPRAPSTACRFSTSTKRTNVVVLKRSMKPGFAGIDNPLYELDEHLDALRRR